MSCLKKRQNRLLQFLIGCAIAGAGIPVAAQSPRGVMTYTYDAEGNVKSERNGLLHVTKHEYDALSRRIKTIDPDAKETRIDYDLRDQLKRVTDARGIVTEYAVDGLGKLSRTTSGDTGVVNMTYDEAGNLKTSTDAKQQTTKFDYDALNRVQLITYADNSSVAYVYDQGTNALGRLSSITDNSGSIRFDYDTFGRVVLETRSIGGIAYTTGYHYDGFGRPVGMTYPNGRKITYGYDALGRIASITSVMGDTVKPLVSAVEYEPFGPVKKLTFGNGQSQNRGHDLDGRIENYTLGNLTMALGYDAAGHIKSAGDQTNPLAATAYDYDKIDRLTGVLAPNSSQKFSYDSVGNRTSKTINASSTVLSYAANSNRLTAVGAQSVQMDENGSTTNRGDGTFTYDARGRMVSFNGGNGVVKYTINGLGQRVRKVSPTSTTIFHYDGSGKLIAETATEGGAVKTQEYVYLGDMPVAVLK